MYKNGNSHYLGCLLLCEILVFEITQSHNSHILKITFVFICTKRKPETHINRVPKKHASSLKCLKSEKVWGVYFIIKAVCETATNSLRKVNGFPPWSLHHRNYWQGQHQRPFLWRTVNDIAKSMYLLIFWIRGRLVMLHPIEFDQPSLLLDCTTWFGIKPWSQTGKGEVYGGNKISRLHLKIQSHHLFWENHAVAMR